MKKLDIAITTAITILFIPLSIWGGLEHWAGPTDMLPFIMMAIAFVYVIFEGVRLKKGLIAGLLGALIGCSIYLPSMFFYSDEVGIVVVIVLVYAGLGSMTAFIAGVTERRTQPAHSIESIDMGSYGAVSEGSTGKQMEASVPEEEPSSEVTPPNATAQEKGKAPEDAKKRKTILYAYLVETQNAGVPGFRKTVVIPATEEELKEKIRTNARCKDADVMIVPPKEWSPPQFSSVSQQELTTMFPVVMVRVQDHMSRSGLPKVSQDELIRNGSIMPNQVSGKVFFVYKITL